MKNLKTILILAVFAAAFASFLAVNPPVVEAAGPLPPALPSTGTPALSSVQQLLNQIAALQAQIKSLQDQVAAIQGRGENWCHTFKRNLKYGNSGKEVRELQTALKKQGFSIAQNEDKLNRFGMSTASAVVGFQQKYAKEVLAPWGLKYGTGFVGSTTRKKLNQLYGCGITEQPYIKVLSPNGGEVFKKGEDISISWISKDINNVYIQAYYYDENNNIGDPGSSEEFSFNGGECRLTYEPISAAVGKYIYKNNGRCGKMPAGKRIKIEIRNVLSEDIASMRDRSDNYFSIVEKDETAGWKTYRNDEYGFEMKFSPTWKIKYRMNNAYLLPEGSGSYEATDYKNANSIFIIGEGYTISVGVKKTSRISLDDISPTISTPTDGSSATLSEKRIEINGQAAYDVSISFMEISRRTVYFVKDTEDGNSYKFMISITADASEKEKLNNSEFNQMLSTFRFIKTTTNGGKSIKEKIVGDYQWNNLDLKTQFSNVFWNKITTYKLAGFSPKTTLTEKRTKKCRGDDGSYLRVEGGLCVTGFWLEKSNGNKINTLEKLVNNFAPIESEAEAVSFVAVTKGDLSIHSNGIPEGHTLPIDNGFLVQLAYNNTFGCRIHEPTGIIFEVSKTGKIQIVAFEKQRPLKLNESLICVD